MKAREVEKESAKRKRERKKRERRRNSTLLLEGFQEQSLPWQIDCSCHFNLCYLLKNWKPGIYSIAWCRTSTQLSAMY